MALQAKGPKEVLEQLADIAKNKLMEYEQKTMAGCLKETPSKVLAANSMYRIAQTILLDQTTTYEEIISVKLFEELSVMIADILTACLTSIPCLCRAIFALGFMEKILKLLHRKAFPCSDTNKMTCIDNWHLLRKQDELHFAPTSSYCETEVFNSVDICLSID